MTTSNEGSTPVRRVLDDQKRKRETRPPKTNEVRVELPNPDSVEVTPREAVRLGFLALCFQFKQLGNQISTVVPLVGDPQGRQNALHLCEQYSQMGEQITWLAKALRAAGLLETVEEGE